MSRLEEGEASGEMGEADVRIIWMNEKYMRTRGSMT